MDQSRQDASLKAFYACEAYGYALDSRHEWWSYYKGMIYKMRFLTFVLPL